MLNLLSGFVDELRRGGLPVSLTEHLDAAEAVHHVPIEDREALKYALGATLVKSSSHWHAFETTFDIYFARGLGSGEDGPGDGERPGRRRRGDPGRAAEGQQGGGGDGGDDPRGARRAALPGALARGPALMRAVARRRSPATPASRRAGRSGAPTTSTGRCGTSSSTRCSSGSSPRRAASAPDGEDLSPLEERLLGDEYRPRVEQLRKAVEDEIRRRLVEDRGAEALAKSVRKPLPEDLDVMHATRDELQTLQRALRPLVASWRCASPGAAATGAGARSTSGRPSGARCRPAASRWSRGSATPGRPNPRSW